MWYAMPFLLALPAVGATTQEPGALPGSDPAAVSSPSTAYCARAEEPGRESEAPPACVLNASRAGRGRAPVVDGRLDDPVWASAQPATGFRQQEPDPGAPASERTEARVVYTDEAVYVGMRLFDRSPDSIRAQFVRRDDAGAVSDWAVVMFDSYYDRRTSFEFATTPTGTRVDVLHLEDVETDIGWDAVWDVATTRDEEGWTAEFRIPLSQLRFSGADELTWGVNFGRRLARRSEVSYWAPIPPTAGRHVSLYGDLVGLRELSPPGGLELLPYTVGRLSRAPGVAADPFYRESDWWGAAGLDLKYGLTSNLTLTGTVNPDFGQVEADPSQVNLTAFETFYAEKRPFFTEGTEIFNFRLAPEGHAFYSRRIGRAPQLRPDLPAGGFSDAPSTASILGAIKLSGKTSGGWSVGLVNAVTGQVDAEVADPSGAIATQAVEPLTNYAAGRVIRDFREGRSGVGLLATAVNRRLSDDRLEALRSSSYLGAFDGWHRFGPGNDYEVSGWLLGTHARGSEAAMARTQRSASHFFVRPDAGHLTYDPTLTRMNGWAAEAAVRKRGGGRWTWTLGAGGRSPGVELNDLGFLSYADTWYGSVTARYSDFSPGPRLRNWYVETQAVQARTWGLELLRPSVHVRGRATFLSFWQLTINADRWLRHRWPWELRGGPALTRSGYTQARWILRTDSRRSWRVQLRATTRADDQGGSRRIVLDPLVDFRPSPRATVSLGPVASWTRDADQYVARASAADSTVYVVGRLRQATLAVQARLSYGFSTVLNLDVYAQPFLSDGRYSAFRTVADAGAADFDRRLPLIDPATLSLDPEADRYETPAYGFRNPDFDVREFRLNAVLRWEYRPGSTLFLVWTQGREDYERLETGGPDRDLDRLFSAPATNVFMLKLNYWIGV